MYGISKPDAQFLFQTAFGVTFDSVVQALSQSMSSLNQTKIFNTILTRDADVMAAVQQRQLGVMSASYRFEAEEGNVQDVVDALNRMNIKAALPMIALFPMYGYSAVQLVYSPENSLPQDIIALPHTAIDFRSGEGYVYIQDEGWQPLANYESQIFIVTYNPFDPPASAVMRSVAVAWVMKYYVLQDWAIYAERLGDPPVLGKYAPGSIVLPSNYTGSVAEYITELLEELKNHAVAALPQGLEVNLLADDRFDGSRAFDMLVDRLDRAIKRAILSSEATVQTGIYGQGGKAADSIRATYGLDTMICSDGEMIRLLFERMANQALVALNRDGRIRVSLNWVEELPTFRMLQAISLLARSGVPFDYNDALKKAGFKPAEQVQGGQ
jgi:hypothetical protein